MNIDSYSSGLVPEGMVSGIFKKSEHEEIMDELKKLDGLFGELAEIKRRLKDLQTNPPPYIPYVPPYNPCNYCAFQWNCWSCPYRYNPYLNRFFRIPYYYDTSETSVPYYYGTVPQWTDTVGGTA